ncbi:pimeloyl-CoA dehydrogenase small subunit [Alkalilimnicola ehrlichii]|uniref:Pimeloyl-CoA dehydrogenase small subunit n=1 Tax=Alkalilimnicola ehrlichii TaxID=351052 RepID=A0A3E0WQW3_9GAMM|nr:acyl-CoA dehydrogenase [Alkalilimnicola ehrlichii]RFA27255.1 pimeloyl-CoA dehydrogenase small subunit [Alkalilimnicola ehrlichii]RFA34365.1 pimeloyl-CoA dehydrogenase small subunit [Alkalilimnicola ehrlichii]
MDFNLTDEQRMLQETVSRLVSSEYDIETRHRYAASEEGFSRDVWSQLADLGLFGVPFSEEAGGFGGGGVELMVVMQEFGRGLVVEPFLSTVVLGGGLIEALGNNGQREEYLGQVIEGSLLLAFAHGEPDSRYNLQQVETRAEKNGGGYRLNGRKAVVFNGDSADKLLVSARTSGAARDAEGISVFLVDRTAPGVTVRAYPNIDGTHAAEVYLDNVDVGADALLGEEGNAFPAIAKVARRGIAALCAEAVGAMEQAVEQTLEYLKQRKQFGVPIGIFQALQHQMVDMRIALEEARSMAIMAANADQAESPEEAERIVHAAKVIIGQAGRKVAESAIQLHGGIGMTWELPLPHFAKRLVMIDHVLGDTDYHLERFSELMETPAA